MMSAVPITFRPAARPRVRNIIAIASGKGGVGKTWLAITLAHALARAGRRTLLFDGDLGLANVDIQLGLMPARDLGGVLTGRLGLRDAMIPFADGGFDIIAGRSGSGRLANIPASRLDALTDDLAVLAHDYHHVVLDLGAGVERTVRQLTSTVGTCIVVATDEPTSLTDAYAFIKLAHKDYPETNIQIVINMATSVREGERTYGALFKACEAFIKISPPLLGIIRRDTRVREAIRCQTPLLTRYPNAEAASDVKTLAQKIMNLNPLPN
jgi:flagellar biosynthesis protein FlhG